MKKYIFGLAAVSMLFAACSSNPEGPEPGPDPEVGGGNTEAAAFAAVAANSPRFVAATEAGTEVSDQEKGGGWILPPCYENQTGRYYSATGIAFGEAADGTETVYVSWHSNRYGDEGVVLDDEGTEDPEWWYGGTNGSDEPSLDPNKTWSGYVDVVTVNPANMEAAELNGMYVKIDNEFKYNHVTYYNGNIYLAATSQTVGAALYVVPTEGASLKADDAYRVNLTGNSANCVTVVNGKLVTVSGRTKGGVNVFDLDDVTDQSAKQISGSVENYGGKYACSDNTYVYVLRNPEAPVIDIYTTSMTKTETSISVVDSEGAAISLKPINGKNVLAVDDNYVYVCCGRNGLHAYNKTTGEYVGSSTKYPKVLDKPYYAANGCFVDDNYIYVATGGGLLILSKELDGTRFPKVKYPQFTGSAPWLAATGKNAEDAAKESSNFVVVKNGYAYVAYGMYGLRIYDLSTILGSAEDDDDEA